MDQARAPAPPSDQPPVSVTRVLIGSPYPVVLAGVRAAVAGLPDLQVIGETGAVPELLHLAGEFVPDVIVTELTLPGPDGPQLVSRLFTRRERRKVLALDGSEDPIALAGLVWSGAAGYVLKQAPAEELVRAIRVVAGSERYGAPVADGDLDAERREREEHVLRLIALGYTNKEIATRIKRTTRTVDFYKARALDRLGLGSRMDLVRYAAQRGWLGPASAPPP